MQLQDLAERGEKARESRLRRAAAREGLRLMKSRRRNPWAADYGAYWLVDISRNVIVAGHSDFGMDLDEVEEALAE